MNMYKLNEPHYLIQGGTPLHGEVRISGAKNAVTKMVIASLLTDETCTFRNVPLLAIWDSPFNSATISVPLRSLNDHTLSIITPYITCSAVSTEVGGLNRMATIIGRTNIAPLRRSRYPLARRRPYWCASPRLSY